MSSLRNPGTVAGNIDIPRLYRTKFQAWPSRLMTNAPSHAGGGNRNASTPWYAIGGRIRPIDGFGGGGGRCRSIGKLVAQSQWPFLFH